MNYKHILKVSLAALTALAVFSGCAKKEFQEITELTLDRCLQPQNLSVKVDASTGDYVTFAWDVNKDAGEYNLVVYTDENMTQQAYSWEVAPDEVPYIARLTADMEYWYTVQAYRVTEEGARVESTLSHLAIFDGSFKTYAVKDNLYLQVEGRSDNSVSLSWSKEVSDYQEVTHIMAMPVKGGDTIVKEIDSDEAEQAAAVVTGLAPSSEYQITLFYMSASRGAVDVWTMADPEGLTTVSTAADLIAMLNSGGNIYLTQEGSPYVITDDSAGIKVQPAGSVKLVGELGDDGSMPVVTGKIELTDALGSGNSLYFESIKFDGNGTANGHLMDHTTDGSPSLEAITFVNCEITNYKSGLIYNNKGTDLKIGELRYESCSIHSMLSSGGDGVDFRVPMEVTKISFENNTIYDGMRTLFRIDQKDGLVIGEIYFANNTVKNVATINDGNNRGLFPTYVPTTLTLVKNIFLWEDGGVTDEATVDKAQLIQDNSKTVLPTLNASGNYVYAQGKDFFKKVSASEAGCTVLDEDPCYNSKGNFFHLENDDLISAGVGASKWWIPYVEKEEDLTQHVIEEAHVWNLQDATLFAGEVKNSRVRDELLLVGTELTPINADGGLNFLSESVLTRKGVPTEGYASFKVNQAGSVDILVENGEAASVVVALLDDNGYAVKGGVMTPSDGKVQKVVIPSVSGEGTVYLYATGAISMTKLAWSLDTTAGDRVLETPKLTVAPVTVKEGDATDVTVSWAAVTNAASYVLKFNKRTQELEEGALSCTIPAETIAALEAGLYNFSIVALPADNDIYYEQSQEGTASIAVQPKGGDEPVEKTITWDFTNEYAGGFDVNDKQTYLYEAGTATVAASADATEVLYLSPNGKSIKYAGKDCTADGISYKPITYGGGAAYSFFKTAKAGKLKITATQGKVASDGKNCTLGIKINGESQTEFDAVLDPYDQSVALLGAKVFEWDIENASGEVQEIQIVKVSGSTSPWIYKIEFTYSESVDPAPVYTWNFTNEYAEGFDVNDSQTYLYEAGTATVTTSTDATEKLYLSPNGKSIKYAGKDCTADGISYKPITYAGGAAYTFFKSSKAGKLKIIASQGKVASDGKNCTLGIKINGVSQTEFDAVLEPYDQSVAVLGAKEFEWDIENTSGEVQEIQIVKVSGSTSPWIYQIVFETK